jgi:DNA/RNA-binding domain of Phe-tRNA-synthetase-like protein
VSDAQKLIADAWVDAAIWRTHPDYVAVLIGASGLQPGPTTASSEASLQAAEVWATQMLAGREPQELIEVQAWRQAYGSFGVKPRAARSSIEALLRRVSSGLPRINRLTDTYNAISIRHLIPIGGEDATGYVGAPRLVIATGVESFDTVADGQALIQHPLPGEPVWRDEQGVTCRRWNWRQCVRTRLTDHTTDAIFILDGIGPDAQDRAQRAARELVDLLAADSSAAAFTVRVVGA